MLLIVRGVATTCKKPVKVALNRLMVDPISRQAG